MNFIQNHYKTLNALETAFIYHNCNIEDVIEIRNIKKDDVLYKVFVQNGKIKFTIEFTPKEINYYEKNKNKENTFDAGIPTVDRGFF